MWHLLPCSLSCKLDRCLRCLQMRQQSSHNQVGLGTWRLEGTHFGPCAAVLTLSPASLWESGVIVPAG